MAPNTAAHGWGLNVSRSPPDRARQLPWLRLHLFVRDVIATPWGKDWPLAKAELRRCAKVRRKLIEAGWFN